MPTLGRIVEREKGTYVFIPFQEEVVLIRRLSELPEGQKVVRHYMCGVGQTHGEVYHIFSIDPEGIRARNSNGYYKTWSPQEFGLEGGPAWVMIAYHDTTPKDLPPVSARNNQGL